MNSSGVEDTEQQARRDQVPVKPVRIVVITLNYVSIHH